jgi:hypothetical protein
VWYAALMSGFLLLGQADADGARQPVKEAAGDLKAQVQALVKDLDAAELSSREGAEQQLLDLGPDVLDLLPPPTNRMSAEVKERLGRVREKLQRAEAEAVTKAALVTIDVDKQPLSKVLAAIQKQSGNQFTDYREQYGQQSRDPKVTLRAEGMNFWRPLIKPWTREIPRFMPTPTTSPTRWRSSIGPRVNCPAKNGRWLIPDRSAWKPRRWRSLPICATRSPGR